MCKYMNVFYIANMTIIDYNNNTGFDIATELAYIVIDEFKAHYTTWNFTGLIRRYYHFVEEEYSDPRSKRFPLMEHPLYTVAMIIIYLGWILILGPLYMRDRKPFKLRRTLVTYNALQVALSAYMFYEHLMAGWLNYYNLKCQPVDYSDGPLSRRMLNLCYVYYISKLTEFADTVFFVLRKKNSQITWLHVYHHSLTPLETWALVKFMPGGNATFPNILNNFVHVCMYFYYMMAALGPEYAKYLWWKRYMTELQIAQFILCIIHTLRAIFNPHCKFSKFVSIFLLINASIFFCLFMNFYIQAYKKKSQQSSQQSASNNGNVLKQQQQQQKQLQHQHQQQQQSLQVNGITTAAMSTSTLTTTSTSTITTSIKTNLYNDVNLKKIITEINNNNDEMLPIILKQKFY